MKISTSQFTPGSRHEELVVAQLSDLQNRQLSVRKSPAVPLATRQSPTASIVIGRRDLRGRFTTGCRPGPGRPRKLAPRHFVPPLDLYQRCVDMDDSVAAWKSVVHRLGSKAARAFLQDLEAEKGAVSFRHRAMEIIAAAEQELLNPKKLPKRITRKRTSKPKARKRSAGKKSAKGKRRQKRRIVNSRFDDDNDEFLFSDRKPKTLDELLRSI